MACQSVALVDVKLLFGAFKQYRIMISVGGLYGGAVRGLSLRIHLQTLIDGWQI
jgi:hypothetical protein